ncbi:ethanolamine utilization protein EutJ [Clostridiales bacterium PH28_bin88]|nr:ethanolamine utilization protein EutJ [Clostridiales bacterium PH28_bin88]
MHGKEPVASEGPLRVGVDLGTANVVVVVVDASGEPVGGALTPAAVVRDGLVVEYVRAIEIVRSLVAGLQAKIGRPLKIAATAVPPGTGRTDTAATAHVVEAAGLEVLAVVDEPTAAATLLEVTDGVVVDVGGGTTGISILQNGQVVYTADEPTGGTHFTLVTAGHFGISLEEAEAIKVQREKQKDLAPLLTPVMEKVATIVERHLRGFQVPRIYLVGGAVALEGFEQVIAKHLGVPVARPQEPLLVTPLGIALSCPVK